MVPTGQDAAILVGPLLRYVDDHRATVWVETDRPCRVEVLGASTRTWTVHGHHYALVRLDGLRPATSHPYEVHLDGVRVWPEAGSPYPPSVIRTLRQDGTFRMAFGSCRRSAPYDEDGLGTYGADALVALAEAMAARGGPVGTAAGGEADPGSWPDALFLAGDQIYADMPSEAMKRRLEAAHADADTDHEEVREEIWDFEEYTWLYRETWCVPAVRWLLSTVPSCMMLDDHDLRDDWNTSWSWRQDVTSKPWWRNRVVGAFASYWVYQHLGNLSPAELDRDPVYRAVVGAEDDDQRTRVLDDVAWRSDTDPDSARWSFYRDFGDERLGIRMVAVDSRCSRNLDPTARTMVDESEWSWLVDRANPRDGTRVDHLLLGSTLPVLLPHGIHHLEGWDEAVAQGAWGRLAARFAERVRVAIDLEHWSAFRASFHRLVDLLEQVCGRPEPPASVLLLSGDVHCSYTAQAHLVRTPHPATAMHQLTMSPFRNPLHLPLRLANRLFEVRGAAAACRLLARAAKVADVPVRWRVDGGPWFDNGVMTVVFTGRDVSVEVDHAAVEGGRQVLRRTAVRRLSAAGQAADGRRSRLSGVPRPRAWRLRRPLPRRP